MASFVIIDLRPTHRMDWHKNTANDGVTDLRLLVKMLTHFASNIF